MVARSCEYCLKGYKSRPSKNLRFCSKSCASKWQWEKNPNIGYREKGVPRYNRSIYDRFKSERKTTGNPNWKGGNASISSIHFWVRDNWEKVKKCKICGTTSAKSYDWSNKEHTYTRNRKDWWILCRSCHIRYDQKFKPIRAKTAPGRIKNP